MPDAPKRMKCAECTKAGKPCVNMSWESLDRTRAEYRKKVEDDETLLATVIARLMRNKKILKQAEERARHKALGLANEMIEAGELDLAEEADCPAASIGICASPVTWGTMGLIEESVANHGTHAAVPGSS
jgi:anaerobic ribonucleoside-triphosphate reductase